MQLVWCVCVCTRDVRCVGGHWQGCQGRGIFLTRSLDMVSPTDPQVAQRYLTKPFLIDGLKRLEYRGYDSAGAHSRHLSLAPSLMRPGVAVDADTKTHEDSVDADVPDIAVINAWPTTRDSNFHTQDVVMLCCCIAGFD